MSLRFTYCRFFTQISFMFLLFAQVMFGQGAAILKGTITDKTTKGELPFATIIIKGTTIGAASDKDGRYVVYNIPAGKQTVEVSYLGYSTQTIEIVFPVKGTITRDFVLSTTIINGVEIVVTGQAQGQLEAINQQLNSDKIANIVSEARIQELPDFNAAASISRLPGVSTTQSSGEANKVVIRGLAPEYNAVTVEGVRLASTGSSNIGTTSQQGAASGSVSTDRSVDLSMITPYMIKSIAVYKSLTPDFNANAVGGVVNMELREAPSELHTDLMWQSGYTQKSNNYGNYRAVGSVSTRFFDDMLGVYFLGNMESYNRDADNMDATYDIAKHQIGDNGYDPVQVKTVQLNRHIENRKRLGGNVILDYRLPSGSIRAINMFTRLNSDYQDYRTIMDYKNKNLNFNYRDGHNTIDLAVNSIQFKYDFGVVLVDMKAANTYSFNSLPKSPFLEFSQTGGIVGQVKENTIPDSLSKLVNYGGPSNTYLGNVSIFSSRYKENNQAFNVNLKMPLDFGGDISGYIKVGGDYRHEQHTNDQETPYITLVKNTSSFQNAIIDTLARMYGFTVPTGKFNAAGFTSQISNLYNSFLDNRYGKFYWAVDPTIPVAMADLLAGSPMYSGRSTGTETGGFFAGIYQQLPNDYTYIERYTAGYLMSEIKFLDFMVVGGVRYEKDNSDFSAFNMVDSRNPQNQPYFPVTVHPHNEFWLPMVQLKYNPLEWLDVRYAFTKTLARPNYDRLSPHVTMDFNLTNVWAGNPDLKTAQAFNNDLIVSLHSNSIGLLTIGGFYKTVKDFSYYTQYKLHKAASPGIDSLGSFFVTPKEGATVYTYINSPYKAFVKGIEVDFQTRLWYLPEPLNGLLLGINYTHIQSTATYPWRDDRSYPNPLWPGAGQPRVIVSVFDSTRSGRLINQPDDIMNAYVGYDYKDFAARVSFVFQGNSVSYVGAFAEQDGFTRNYFRIDASVRQILPWAGIEMYMDLNNLNNQNNTSSQMSIGGFTNEQNYGFTGNLGVRLRM